MIKHEKEVDKMKKIIGLLEWNLKDFIKMIIGSLMFCIAVNIFIVPNELYTGGLLGISQLIRSIIIDVFNLNITFDFSGILYYLLNIPLFFIAYKSISKTFFIRTLLVTSIQTVMLSLIPTNPIVNDVLTNVLVGGLLGGTGLGIVLSCGASTGGTDIIGFIFAKKNNELSVGKLGLMKHWHIAAIICAVVAVTVAMIGYFTYNLAYARFSMALSGLMYGCCLTAPRVLMLKLPEVSGPRAGTAQGFYSTIERLGVTVFVAIVGPQVIAEPVGASIVLGKMNVIMYAHPILLLIALFINKKRYGNIHAIVEAPKAPAEAK